MAELTGIEGKLEVARHDADDGVGPSIEIDGCTKNLGIGLKALKPDGVTDEGHGRAFLVFLLGEGAAEQGLHAEHGQQRCRDAFCFGREALAGAADFIALRIKARERDEGFVVAGEADHVGCGNTGRFELMFNAFMQANEAFRLVER